MSRVISKVLVLAGCRMVAPDPVVVAAVRPTQSVVKHKTNHCVSSIALLHLAVLDCAGPLKTAEDRSRNTTTQAG